MKFKRAVFSTRKKAKTDNLKKSVRFLVYRLSYNFCVGRQEKDHDRQEDEGIF